jgi:hypothetical protein
MTVLVNAYSTLREVPPLEFQHQLVSTRGLEDEAMLEHLNGFAGYAYNKCGEMNATIYGVIQHIQRVRQQLSFVIEETQFNTLTRWAVAANAILFLPDGSIRAPTGVVLVDDQGAPPELVSEIPFPPNARVRQSKNQSQLQNLGVQTPITLPPVVAEEEVLVRSAQTVAERALALFAVAVRAESLGQPGQAIPVMQMRQRLPLAFEGLSPLEQQFMASEPEPQSVTQFVWRYESLWTLSWALSLVPNLPFAVSICDVPALAKTLFELDHAQFLRQAHLRPVADLLDALDLHYRLHWAVRQANLRQQTAPANLEPGVVFERHYALNWLVQFQNASWDDVDTPT